MGRCAKKPLNPNKLQGNIHSLFPMMDDDEFKAICKESITGAYKSLQAAFRYL